MLVDDGDGIRKNLRRAVAVLVLRELHLMITKLVEQALAQVAAGHAGRIELADDFQRFVQIGGGKSWLVSGQGRSDGLRRGSYGGGAISGVG